MMYRHDLFSRSSGESGFAGSSGAGARVLPRLRAAVSVLMHPVIRAPSDTLPALVKPAELCTRPTGRTGAPHVITLLGPISPGGGWSGNDCLACWLTRPVGSRSPRHRLREGAEMSTTWDAWNYRDSADRAPGAGSMVGYHVHATDGDIGKIDEASDQAGASSVVVDTGPWIFGRKVVLPAGTIDRVDDDDRKV